MILKNICMNVKTVFFIICIAKSVDGIGGVLKRSLTNAQTANATEFKGGKKGGQTMDELYTYMREKLKEMHEKRTGTVEIDCVEFMQLMKMICYMKQIRRIVEDDM